jgi:arsenite transporter
LVFLAAASGVASGRPTPGIAALFDSLKVGETTGIPIVLGLILMMYPPRPQVKCEELGDVLRNCTVRGLSLLQNWVIGPASMLALASLFLRGAVDYLRSLAQTGPEGGQ